MSSSDSVATANENASRLGYSPGRLSFTQLLPLVSLGFSSEQFAELGSVQFLASSFSATTCSLVFLTLVVLFWTSCGAVFSCRLSSFSGLVLRPFSRWFCSFQLF